MSRKGGANVANDGSESNIQTFLRIRPSKTPSGYMIHDEIQAVGALQFSLPEGAGVKDFINNSKIRHNFQFNGIIPMEATQEEVFKKVGISAVQNAIDGFNSTIFAYGQTGSGKTFTLTGGPERYSDRGIIPRAISMLYNEFRTRTDMNCKAFISYLEIYMERGYDLLDPSHETKELESLPKVTMLEDEFGNFHLKNLSMHAADTEEDALNLLFMGDTNRAIAETPMNMASSRSHCIFSISIESRAPGSDKVRRSKLHLVDLAGSERVGKTNSSGTVLNEAKYINGSLFFLEMVIVALYEKATKGRNHVPYRNSMMTSVLRDSLGGNCKTIMIATVNPEAAHTDESLSTCRFAQRVSLIKNKATINEDVDPSLIIRRLKAEVLNLREEIAFLKGETGEGEDLTPQELDDLKEKTRAYCLDNDPHSVLNIGSLTLTKIKRVFSILKGFVQEGGGASGSKMGGAISHEAEDLVRQIKDLKSCLLQRDNEIAILVNMVKKGKTADDVGTASRGASRLSSSEQHMSGQQDAPKSSRDQYSQQNPSSVSPRATGNSNFGAMSYQQQQALQAREREQAREERIVKRHLFGVPPPTDKKIFDDAALSFEWFRERCSSNAAMEENRELLREKISEAKTMGERANQSRSTITYLKNSIEAVRREKALQRLDGGKQDDVSTTDEESPEEQTYRRAIEQEKVVYKESFERLRVLKPEIEHIRKVLEKGRVVMQNQFDQWYQNLHARDSLQPHESLYSAGGDMEAHAVPKNGGPHSNFPADKKESNRGLNMNESKLTNLSIGNTTVDASSLIAAGSKDDNDVNEDIMAFYLAKEELLKRRGV